LTLEARVAAFLARPVVVATRRILDRYGAASGGLLAGGLAYAALFAIVPAALLVAGVVGLVYSDPAAREGVVDTIVGVLPPMRELIETVLKEAASVAGPVSIIGAIILIWGTSRFFVAFEGAIARVMGGDRPRGVFHTNIVALVAVVLMIGAIPASAVLAAVAAFLEAGEASGVLRLAGAAISIVLGVLPLVLSVVAMTLVYRVLPRPAPAWRAAIPPGIAVGLTLTLIARLFAYLAPRLIGAAALIGTLTAVFAALAWLSLSFQAILLGAAWVKDRGEQRLPPGARKLD
jgi:membrane protein